MNKEDKDATKVSETQRKRKKKRDVKSKIQEERISKGMKKSSIIFNKNRKMNQSVSCIINSFKLVRIFFFLPHYIP